MQPHTIALIAAAESDAAVMSWWSPIFRNWPEGFPPPRLELLTPDSFLSSSHGLKSVAAWDAAILAPTTPVPDRLVCRVLDVLQQSLVPSILLVPTHGGAGSGHSLDQFHTGSVIPLPANGDPRAAAAMVFALAQRQSAIRTADQSLRMAQSFQGETAAEIDRLHQELLLAAKVQRDFLPKHMPAIDGLDCAVLFRPAGFVSGDTYDISRLDEYHISFFLADAMGHGVPAALMTLYISGSLPRKEIGPSGYRIIPPAESLKRLNVELNDSIAGAARFVTAICGVIDTRTGHITIACAGHPPPLRIGRHGVRPVDVSGMLLGVVPDFDYQQVTIKLEPDELLVIHSDGIENAFMHRGRAGDGPDRLARPMPTHYMHMASMRRGSALDSLAAAMDHLVFDLDAQAGSLHQDDDVTVLAFETTCVRESRTGGEAMIGRAAG